MIESEVKFDQISTVEEFLLIARRAKDASKLFIAEGILMEGKAAFPDNTDILHDLARILEARGEWQKAADVWRRFFEVARVLHWWAFTSLAICLYRCGMDTEAANLFLEAKRTFPEISCILFENIRALVPTQDPHGISEVIREWLNSAPNLEDHELLFAADAALGVRNAALALDCMKRVSDQVSNRVRGAVVAKAKSFFAEDDPAHLSLIESMESRWLAAGAAAQDLFRNIESLGGDYPGCEIGLIQRRFGVEPIGLLRWCTTPLDRLVAALTSRFDGIGSDAQTEVYITPGGEYKTKDRRFYMDMLTFVKSHETTFDDMREKSLKRIGFLKRKIIQDLTDGEKVFAYRTFSDDIGIDDIMKLRHSMTLYGRNCLLYLRIGDASHPVGTIEVVNVGLLIGYVARFSCEPVKELYLEGWLEVVAAAVGHWRAVRGMRGQG